MPMLYLKVKALREFLSNHGSRFPMESKIVGKDVHTNGGSLSSRLNFFIVNSRDLMDANSELNSRKPIIDVGAGYGDFSFEAGVQNEGGRLVFSPEIVPARCAFMRTVVSDVRRDMPSVSVPTVVEGDFCKEVDETLERALANEQVIIWFNNAEGCMSRNTDIQTRVENKIRGCAVGSILVSLDRVFRDDFSWEEESFVTTVLRRDISWRSNEKGDDCTTTLPIFKYTKRDYPYDTAYDRRKREVEPVRLHFQYLSSSPAWPLE